MAKLDELMKAQGGHAAESLGVGVSRGIPGNQDGGGLAVPARLQGVVKAKNAAEVPVDKIIPDPDQPREEFEPEALERLAMSLKTRGQLQPIRVRWEEGRGAYIIVCGERRWRAAAMAGLETVSCVVSDTVLAPAELLALQLVENALREDLRPIEQAKAFRSLIEANAWSTHQLARELAVPQSTVVKLLAILELPTEVQDQVQEGKLSTGTAYEVSRVADPEERRELAGRAIAEKLTRQEVVEAIRTKAKPSKSRTVDYQVAPGVVVSVRFRGEPQVDPAKALRLALKQAAAARPDSGESPPQAA